MKNKLISIAFAALLLSACGKDKEPAEQGGTQIPGVPETATNTWMMTSTASVASYTSQSPSNTMVLHMARNEAEHLQLVVKTPVVGTFTWERNTSNEGITLEVKEIMAFKGVEDVLVPIPNGTTTTTKEVKLWITVESSRTAPAGKFNEVITFKGTSAGDTPTVIGLEINVYDVTLPVTQSITSLFGINPGMIAASSVTGEDLIAKRKEFSDALLKRRITPYFCTWLAGTMKVECVSSPYPVTDARTLSYLGDTRMKDVVLPYHNLSAGDFSTLMNGVKTQYPDKGRLLYIWDEPTLTTEYTQINTMSSAIHAVDAGAKVLTTFFRGPNYSNNESFADVLSVWDHLTGTSIFCTGVWSLGQSENKSSQARNKCGPGQEWWQYVCMGDRPGLAHSSTTIENRAVMWRAYKEQTGGFLYWVVNGFSSLSPLNPRNELPAGDGLMLYPGTPFGYDGLAVSMRLERWRDGAEDYELMKLMEKRKSRGEVVTLLNNVYTGPAAANVTSNQSHVEVFHRKLLEEIQP